MSVLKLHKYSLARLNQLNSFFRSRIIENPRYQVFGEYYFRIPLEEKVVALTFDDGPLEPYTRDLLSVLSSFDVRSTFFFVGMRIEEHPELARLAHEQGHQICNHSYSHQALSFIPLRVIRSEIERTDQLIRQTIGVDYPIDFRAPYSNKFLGLPYLLRRMQKRHILFDFFPNPRDWWGAPPKEVVGSIVSQVRPGSIIVLHDGNLRAAPLICDYTSLLIENLRKIGYRFCTVSELIALKSTRNEKLQCVKMPS